MVFVSMTKIIIFSLTKF